MRVGAVSGSEVVGAGELGWLGVCVDDLGTVLMTNFNNIWISINYTRF